MEKMIRECHEMLTEIVEFIREVKSDESKNERDVRNFIVDLSANIFYGSMNEKAKKDIMSSFNDTPR